MTNHSCFVISAATFCALTTVSPLAFAEETSSAFGWSAEYVADVIGPVSGGVSQRGRFLDNLSIGAELDLDQTVGWRGATLSAHLLNNSGGMPNEDAGTLEGVDNIEVARQRAKIFELYLTQKIGETGSLARLGFFDLNADFYSSDAASLLISPAFGIGSELASTGPNGPSIFPSTSLGAMGKLAIGGEGYLQAAILNAEAGVFGDPGGAQIEFEHGALLIAEAGLSNRGKSAIGVWTYTDEQDDIRLTDAAGAPARQRAYGVYGVFERPIFGQDGAVRSTTAFMRVGVSDGDTTPFAGGGQAGLLVSHAFVGRPNAQFSAGVRFAHLNHKFQENLIEEAIDAADSEYGLELTYSDQITPWLRAQPVIQVGWNSGGDSDADPVVIAGLRLAAAFQSTPD